MPRAIEQWLAYFNCDEATFRACLGELKQFEGVEHLRVVSRVDGSGLIGIQRQHRLRMRWRLEQYKPELG
jgi:hypothetical protein